MNNDIKKKSIREQIFSGLFWKFSERITAQCVSLVITIILARMLSPGDYGSVALVMVFITIANVFVSNGFGNALIQKKNADILDFSSVLYTNILISLCIYVFLFFLAPYVARFYYMPVLCPVLRILGLRIIVASINSVQHAYVARKMLFKRFFWSTLFGTLISGVIGVILAYNNWGVWAIVAQYLVNTIIDTIVLWVTVKWRPVLKCSWKRAKKLLSYSWKLLISSLIDTVYSQLRNLIIGKIYSPSDLAYYNQGDRYPQLLVININSSMGSVLFPAMSKFQDQPDKIKQLTRKSIQISSYVMWPMMIGLAIISEPLVRVILTEKWLPCVVFLQIFCISYGFWPIHTANLQAINAIGRSDIFLKLEIIKKTIGIIALIVSMCISPVAIALSLIFTGIISTVINATPNIKLLGYSYKEQISDMLPAFLIAVLMGCMIYPLKNIVLNDMLLILSQSLIGVILYIFFSKLTNQKGYIYIVKIIRTKIGGN